MPVPTIVTLSGLARLKRAPTSPVQIHLTQKELEKTLADAQPRRATPRRGADVFVIRRLPGGGALVYPQCRGRRGRACDSRIVFVRVPTLRKPLARYICNCLKATTPKVLPCNVIWIKVDSFYGPGCFRGTCSNCSYSVYGSVMDLRLVCECDG